MSSDYAEHLIQVLSALDLSRMGEAVNLIRGARMYKATVYICGNGGSAATAEHFATDLQRRGVKAFSLASNISATTAWSNDQGFINSFANQLCVRDRGDVLVAISVSGDSENVIQAVSEFGNKLSTIALVGANKGRLVDKATLSFVVPTHDVEVCEDVHLAICHMIARNL